MNDVINCDALEGLKTLKDNSINCIITSPPYNVKEFHSESKKYGTYTGNNMPEEKYQEWQIEILDECHRVLKQEGSMFYNHKPRFFRHVYIHPLEWIYKTKFYMKQEIIWDRKGTANHDHIRFFPQTERIYWLVKQWKIKIKNECSLSDVWQVPPKPKRDKYGHPAIMEPDIVQNILSVGDWETILDPFAGVGTTGVVVKSMGRKFIGFEISEKYCKTANSRLTST